MDFSGSDIVKLESVAREYRLKINTVLLTTKLKNLNKQQQGL